MRHETLIKIMSLFRKDIERGFTILGISKELKIGYRPAYNHIKTLSEEDVIKVNTIGRAKQCFLNLQNPNCRKLLEQIDILNKEKLYEKYPQIKNILEDLITRVSKLDDIRSLVLFGSYAKGTASKGSDMDLFFIVSKLEDRKIRGIIEGECSQYEYSHNIKINPVISDIKEFKGMLSEEKINVGKEVKKYGLPLYGIEQFWRLIT